MQQVRDIPQVSNEALILAKIPHPTASLGVLERFAMTFNGYEHAGSLENAYELAKRRAPANLSELRTCLFTLFRANRFSDCLQDPEVEGYVRDLVGRIRKAIEQGSASPADLL